MQSILQYRRFGKALEAQLARDDEKVAELRSQRRNGGQRHPSPAHHSSSSSLNDEDVEAAYPVSRYEGKDEVELDSSDSTVPTSHPTLANTATDTSEQEPVESPSGGDIAEDDAEHDEIESEISGPYDLRTVTTQATTGTTLGLALSGIEVRDRTTKEGGQAAGQVFVVSYENEKDPMDPHNWSFPRRVCATMVLSLIGGIVGWASAIDSAVIPQASAEFGVSDVAESLATGIFLIGFGCGALVAGPFSETVGRNPVYIITMALYMLFIIGAALAPNLGGQLICRFLAGVFGATPLVCAGGSVSDLWTPAERVFAFPLFATLSFLGPEMGPVIGGWVGDTGINWRWVEWITLIVSGVILSIVIVFQPETYGPILLKWKAKHLRRLTGDTRYRGTIEIRKSPLLVRLLRALYRPLLMTAQEPIIILLALYMTVTYIILFTFLTGYTFIYTDIYGLSQGMTGLCFLGLVVGILLCATLIPVNMQLRKRDIARAKALGPNVKVAPESRLYWAMIGAPVIPISMFWMAWTSRSDISLWSPLLASVMTGFGILCVFMTCYQYMIDSYEVYAASALASVTLIRYIVAGAMIEVSIPFYKNMGVPYTLTILGSISALLVPIPYAFYKYGPSIRKRSKYAFQ